MAMLETEGFTVYSAVNESDLFNLIQNLNIKPEPQSNQDHANLIVLMDYKLADTDGLTIIRTMQQNGYLQIRYFILSANTKDEIPNAESCKDIEFIKKPLYFNDLIEVKESADSWSEEYNYARPH